MVLLFCREAEEPAPTAPDQPSGTGEAGTDEADLVQHAEPRRGLTCPDPVQLAEAAKKYQSMVAVQDTPHRSTNPRPTVSVRKPSDDDNVAPLDPAGDASWPWSANPSTPIIGKVGSRG